MEVLKMNVFDEKLIAYMAENHIQAEHLIFKESCHSVEEAAIAANATPHDFVKNICMLDDQDHLIVAIVKGEDKTDLSKIKTILGVKKLRTATADEILKHSGYICGGVPSFGYKATFFIDTKVMDNAIVYTGGGSQNSLVRISPHDLLNANGGQVTDIRK
jgi:prolyl-tRNA editing enzyme YbaK/EbsC (Cys-tRNA(Pro) deacylase)